MYRILIVDDEKDERNVIRFLLNKYSVELDIEEAANGKEAMLQLMKHPVDILFTDVKMPFIGGIELATNAREMYPHLQIIFFSGHDDFEFIKKALSLRATNYILKPVKPTEFHNTITSVIETIKSQEKELEQREANTEFLKTHILYRLINKTPIDILSNEYPRIDFTFLNDYTWMILMEFEEPFFDRLPREEDSFFFYRQIKEFIPYASFEFINLSSFQILLIFKGNRVDLKPLPIAAKIQKHVYSIYGVNCYLSVSKEISSPTMIPIVYDELEQYLEERFFYTDIYIYPVDAVSKENNDYLEQDEHILQAIQTALQFVDSNNLRKNIDNLIKKYQTKQEISHINVRYLFSRLLQMLCQELPHYEKEFINKKVEEIYSCLHFYEIEEILIGVQNEVINKLEFKEKTPKHVINIVQQYIHEHYAEDLSLNLLAEQVYLTPGYLSEIFIQESGCGINKYIKNIRMDSAKYHILTTNMKINDICTTVGYHNISYFVRSFREHFGSSPEKYRQMERKQKETF
ncbi:response regulator [Sporosarcina sp. E16_3]|uniref:response regulator transcription factor n=1 Tax=Sporosarcina sp. E16_3 TaxID=2789293 RepID=UPI001A92FF4E|nr:response regulator [Sporosarcina sp. E16_3]MBO0603486.1 response regulator [Sporosarcina sp. E16_3]